METVGRIIRAHSVKKLSVREIARRLHVSRKTVREAIDADGAEFTYTRVAPPSPGWAAMQERWKGCWRRTSAIRGGNV